MKYVSELCKIFICIFFLLIKSVIRVMTYIVAIYGVVGSILFWTFGVLQTFH